MGRRETDKRHHGGDDVDGDDVDDDSRKNNSNRDRKRSHHHHHRHHHHRKSSRNEGYDSNSDDNRRKRKRREQSPENHGYHHERRKRKSQHHDDDDDRRDREIMIDRKRRSSGKSPNIDHDNNDISNSNEKSYQSKQDESPAHDNKRRDRLHGKDRSHRSHRSKHDRKHKSKEKKHRRYDSGEDSKSSDDDDSYHRRSKHDRKDRKKHNKKTDKKKSKKDKKKQNEPQVQHAIMVDKSKLTPLGEARNKPPNNLIDPENDYFSYHQQLWVYLYREEGLAFNDLSSDEARSAFQRFADRYNSGNLEAAYYDGLPSEALEECKTTRHTWSFKTSATERRGLEALQQGVHRQTEYSNNSITSNNQSPNNRGASSMGPDYSKNVASSSSSLSFTRKTPDERLKERVANRRLREHVQTAEEEFNGGRKEGHERQIEKRKEKAARIHGSARDREDSGMVVSDDVIYGQGDMNLNSALARERQRTAQRQEKQLSRIEELQKKDQDRQENMLKMLGLSNIKPGQKITIQERKEK